MNELYEYATIYGCDSDDDFDYSDLENREYTEYIYNTDLDKDWSTDCPPSNVGEGAPSPQESIN